MKYPFSELTTNIIIISLAFIALLFIAIVFVLGYHSLVGF